MCDDCFLKFKGSRCIFCCANNLKYNIKFLFLVALKNCAFKITVIDRKLSLFHCIFLFQKYLFYSNFFTCHCLILLHSKIAKINLVKIAKQFEFIFIKLCKNYIELKINMWYNKVAKCGTIVLQWCTYRINQILKRTNLN